MHAVDIHSHEPISGLLVGGWTKGNRDHEVAFIRGVQKSKGDLEHPPSTDDDGRAELEVPSGTALVIDVHRRYVVADYKFVELSALRPGERRDLLVEIDRGKEIHLFGRVVEATGSRPIPGALVRACVASLGGNRHDQDSEELARATTDEGGNFEIKTPESEGTFVRIEAEGFGLAVLQRFAGHDAPDRALVVQLSKAATLEAQVRDAGGSAIPDVKIHLSADGYSFPPDAGTWADVDVPEERWSATTAADGSCVIAGLSPGVAIRIELSKAGQTLRREEDALTLEPGQVLRREWILGGGATLNGLVLDQDSRPVPELEIWLTKSEPYDGHSYEAFPKDRIADHAVSDGDGRFQLKDVAPGTWWLGPAPRDREMEVDASGTERLKDPSPNAVAPIASPVEVNSVASQDVTLHVQRGLFIRGRVVDPDGKPATEAGIWATASSSGLGPHCESGPAGVFVIGPVAPGRYTLVADAMERFARSDPIEADAGASDIVLRLKAGGGLHGRVVDTRTGKPCAAEMVLTPRVSGEGLFGSGEGFGVDDKGIVDRQGLLPGDYDLAARTEDGCFGVLAGITVVAGASGKEFVLPVSPGGTLKIRYEGAHTLVAVSLRLQGVLLAFPLSVNAGKVREMHAPAGAFVLEVQIDDAAPKDRDLHLDPGEVKEIQLTDGD